MLEQDQRLNGVGSDWTDPGRRAAGLSTARLERYRELLRSTGVREGVWRTSDVEGADTVWFTAQYNGNVASSDEKGYVYATDSPGELFDSLDPFPSRAEGLIAYRHISGNWYLYRAIDP
jgi:hypothetical protein